MSLKLVKVSEQELNQLQFDDSDLDANDQQRESFESANKALLPKLLEGLNPAQSSAVTTLSGPVLIVAGAGSGKTRVLTHRMAYLIASGTKPWEILALTFTNKAAQEMRERIGGILGEKRAKHIMAGTFHSVFARLLRYDAESLGYTSSFTIYDTDDSLSAIKNAMQLLSISQQTLSPTSVRSAISSAKNQMISWQEFMNSASEFRERQIGKIYEQYERRLKMSNAMDFDDLLLNMIRLLESSPDMLAKYQAKFSHILVDEYQDTNRAQYIAITLLAGGHRNLCVVGDDAQSIYRWRGADIRNILDFQKDYPETNVIRLEQNYRSTKSILSAADGLIKNNRKQIPKTLWTDNDQGQNIHVLPNRDDRDEAEKVAVIIQNEVRKHNAEPKDIAVLYRTNSQSQALEDALRRSNIPYTIVSGISFYKRKEIKDTTAYLKLLINPLDAESVLRVVNEPARGLGDTSIERIKAWADAQNVPLIIAFSRADEIPALQKRAQTAAKEFAQLIERYSAKVEQLPVDDLALEYIEATGLMRMYKELHTDEGDDRHNNIVRLLTDIAEYRLRDEEPSLVAYLQQLALLSDTDLTDTSTNRVALMTLHAAKGLEFPAVIIAGAEEGLLPLIKGDSHPDEKEEERRLFYVGITRARMRLYITYAERRMRFGSVEYSTPSSFLYELPADVIDWNGKNERRQAEFERTRFDSPATNSQRPPQFNPYTQVQSGSDKKSKPPMNVGVNPQSLPDSTSSDSSRSKPALTAPSFNLPDIIGKGNTSKKSSSSYDQTASANEYSQMGESEYSQIEPTHLASSVRKGMKVRHKLFGDGAVESVVGVGDNQKAVIYFPGIGRKNLMVKFAKLEIVG